MRVAWFIFSYCLWHNSIAAAPDIAVPRSVNYPWMSIADWYHRHADDVALAYRGEAEMVFLGDSITEGWQGKDRQQLFKQYFSNYRSVNFGIGGDQTQNLLWRLKNSTKGHLDPKVVILLIGANNLIHSKHQPEQVARGVAAVLQQVELNFPSSRVFLHGILPFDELPHEPSRQLVADTNRLLQKLADNKTVFYYDFGEVFLDKNGNIPQALMADFLHPTAEGMRRWGAVISEVIDNWFEEFEKLPREQKHPS